MSLVDVNSSLNDTVNNIIKEGKKILEERINLADIPDGPNFALFMCSLGFGIIWIIYITFFNSRVVGSVLTRITNKFISDGYIKIGSLSWSVLSGKVMFRDVFYINVDYTVRVQDGFLIFRWWRSYVPKNVSEDLSHSDTRLSIQLNGFEFHVYNRTSLYKQLEKKFGLESSKLKRKSKDDASLVIAKDENSENPSDSYTEFILGKNWRDLIPVIKVDITSGKFAFGNKLLPTTLVISVEEMRSTYSTKPAGNPLDHFMHFVKCKAENLKVLLAPSLKYTGLRDEAPRFMGEGFVVVSSNQVDLYYYMDEAGLVSEDKEVMPPPEWGVDIKCGKATNFSYGPWADRQRELLYKFFFPTDYQNLEPTPSLKTGDRRTSTQFLLRLSTQYTSTFDILFSKLKETNVIHINAGQGTNFEIKIPWLIKETGYSTKLNGTLMMVEATTSLPFRDLLECETLEFEVNMNYAMTWNAYQEWNFDIKPTKTSLNFIFAHKWFFQDLLDDWAPKSAPDLLYFVPYTWKFNFAFKYLEFLTLANEFNWIDTSSTNQENCHIGIIGEVVTIKFDLLYTEFLPPTVPFIFQISGNKLDMAVYLPETNTSHDILYSLDMNARIIRKDGEIRWKRDNIESKWRRLCRYEDGWIDCWTAPQAEIDIEFIYHPIPLPGPAPLADLPTPEAEALLLGPLRAPIESSSRKAKIANPPVGFDPEMYEADQVKVFLRLGSSTIYPYGTLIRNFMHLKENLFGTDQHFTPMEVFERSKDDESHLEGREEFDGRLYRSLNVILEIKVRDLQAHLIKNCYENDPCPYLVAEELVFEMDKTYRETRLQLVLSPVVLRAGQNDGFLVLTGLQFRGNAMFSDVDRPLGSDTLEYAWLIEIQCGSLLGKISAPQLYSIFNSLETFIYLMVDKENVLKNPRPYKICQHDASQKECPFAVDSDKLCATEDDVKYKMIRFSADSLDVHVVDKSSSLRLQMCPLRVSTCNLHGRQTKEGVTALIKQIYIQQFINSNFPLSRSDQDPNVHHEDIWIESGSIKLGPVYIEGSTAGYFDPSRNFQEVQHIFLQKHDRITKRLWFLWPNKEDPKKSAKCGCIGGCSFFGSNSNGLKFFKPDHSDIEKRTNLAIFHCNPDRFDPGYGQSILKDQVCVLENIGYFKNLSETCLPSQWPLQCHQLDQKLPFCPDFRTHKSNSSNTSTETPRHPRQHRSFSEKRGKRPDSFSGTPLVHPRKARNSISTSFCGKSLERSEDSNSNSIVKACSLTQVDPEKTLVRTESLVSDVLSFYSFDGENRDPSLASPNSAPLSPRVSMYSSTSDDNEKTLKSNSNENFAHYETYSSPSSASTQYVSCSEKLRSTSSHSTGLISYQSAFSNTQSPTSTQYETAPSSSYSPTQGRLSSISYDTATLQPDTTTNNTEDDTDSDTLSASLSSTSFASAVSEKEEFGLVDLHMQLSKPITDSPLLMTSYISHLTQLRCSHWSERVIANLDDRNAKVNYSPKYDLLEEGIGSMKMINKIRREDADEKNIPSPSKNNNFNWDDLNSPTDDDDKEFVDKDDSVTTLSQKGEVNASKTTIVVTFKGAIDIVLSPVILESFQRILESLTPVFKQLHPISVVNRLHSSSLDRVESQNTLKKERSLDLQEKLVENPANTIRIFEKSISSYTQASLHLPEINVMVLQASVVEEMCAFSALDNVRDITCVSLLALGVHETTFQFCKTSQSKKNVQMFLQKQRALSGKKKKSKYKITPDMRSKEPFTFESSETQKEELMLRGSLNKIHAQLRRLKNDSSILKDASITAIPAPKSKVFFEYVNIPRMSSLRITPDHDQEIPDDQQQQITLGYNMCECGFEGINVKVAKRSSNQEEPKSPDEHDVEVHQGKRSTASGSVELKTSWFNFAAPPKTPISRKVDFTKLDWNLLSTASPSINAWLSPLDRLQNVASNCVNTYHQRVGAVMAALMAEVLEVAAENFLKLTKYDKSTALSNTLRDDPSCQLCSILLRYMLKEGNLIELENNLDWNGVPPLVILRQGIVVLSRQWKNALYTPILIEYNLRSKSLKNIYNTPLDTVAETKTDSSYDDDDDDEEDFDDRAMLLKGNSNNIANHNKFTGFKDGSISSDFSAILKSKFSPLTSQNYSKIPMEDLVLLEKSFGRKVDGGSDSNGSKSRKSSSAIASPTPSSSSSASPPSVIASGGEVSSPTKIEEESLYDWMKRQTLSLNRKSSGGKVFKSEFEKKLEEGQVDVDPIQRDDVSVEKCLKTAGCIDDMKESQTTTTPQTKSMHLIDAHLIFEPLLSSLGLMPQQIQNLSLKNLGTNVSVLANVDQFKIDIVESEFGKLSSHRRRIKSKRTGSTITTDNVDNSPAFLCQKVYVQIDFKKVTDIPKPSKVLYISRAQLKRQTSSIVNFSIDIFTISQKVNMPLLRLLNQILTMHQNVKETNEEIKERTHKTGDYMKHKKSSSTSSTSSNLSAHMRTSESYETTFNKESCLSGKRGNSAMQSTPSPSLTFKSQLRNRPKSFAQKFRPNSRLAGYSNLESPFIDQQDSFVLTSAPLEKITEEQVTVRCWKTLYNLLELYSTMPTTKTVQRHSLTPSSVDAGILLRKRTVSNKITTATTTTTTTNNSPDIEINDTSFIDTTKKATKEVSFAKADLVRNEHTPLIVFGIAKIRRTRLTATLSGLKLKGEIMELQSSVQYKEKIRAPMKGVVEASVIGTMTETNIVLIEGNPPKQQTVVQVHIGKSQLLHSSHMWKTKDKNSGTMSVALVQVEIPQHPVDLHGIVTRGTKELSSTLQEFKNVRILQRGKTVADDMGILPEQIPSPKPKKRETTAAAAAEVVKSPVEDSNLIKPLVMRFNLILHKFVISAALLPSLMAEYSMEKVTSRGVTGSKAKFVVDFPKHTLSFNTKIQDVEENSESSLPSEASIDLPPVHVKAEYVLDDSCHSRQAPDGSVVRGGNYLSAEAEIGELEHCLTTDLLNHLVFVQKVFMKEVNEVVQKMSGADRPVPVWTEFGEEIELEQQRLLYSVVVRLKQITITATTPANSALRFETGTSDIRFSNRIENGFNSNTSSKLSTKANIHLKLSLGQIIRDSIYFEAEPQFQQQAYFKTTIQLRNAFQGENQDVIHITLSRPLVFVQPVAVDRAILVWLSYKNAWEYWTEQRLNLNKEVLVATEQVLEKVPLSQITSQLSAQHVGTLFLQLNVQDIGLCLPLVSTHDDLTKTKPDLMDGQCALVLTIESTSISVCSSHAMVCTGNFKELCVRFNDDFNHTLDDWKPDSSELMNLCLVSEGSYEVCSSTKGSKDDNAKWLLNIQWQMTGVDVHVDTNIGKHLSALGHTLTTITGEEDDEDDVDDEEKRRRRQDTDSEEDGLDDTETIQKRHKIDIDLPPFLFNQSLSRSIKAKYLEQEINEQAKIVEDLQKLGACDSTVSSEMKKLTELQNIASKTFRQDLAQKLRRQKSKATYIKEKFGLGVGGPNHHPTPLLKLGGKSKSLSMPSPIKEDFGDGFSRKKLAKDDLSFDEEDEFKFNDTQRSESSDQLDSLITLNLTTKGHTTNANTTTTTTTKLEPNVDFEFDVKIFVNSGKCVLHSSFKEESKKMKKDRSFSGNIMDSPNPPPRKLRVNEFKSAQSSARLMKMATAYAQDLSTVYIPGLDVRVRYMSRTDDEVTSDISSSLPSSSSNNNHNSNNSINSKRQSKKGTLTAWMTLQSIPEETIITPSILEFLEQALEPIPTFNTVKHSEKDNGGESGNEDFSEDSSQPGNVMSYTSFPVDVIVYFHIQSSTFRFSCLPVSRVECMLGLPSLDLVFSSKRADEDSNESVEAIGGLSVTGCLNDFNLYVFHPYGGRKKKQQEETNFSPLSSEERKDSLNVNVAFVKFHISRSRKINFEKPTDSKRRSFGGSSIHGNNHTNYSNNNNNSNDSSGTEGLDGTTACVRFSTIIEIGSASFNYDMRRLTEILAFPRAWYRRTLVRRLFLGELKTTTNTSSFYTERESPSSNTDNKDYKSNTTSNTNTNNPSVGRRVSLKRSNNRDEKKSPTSFIGQQMTSHSWETLVIFAIHFKALKVHMNMGNVMGNVDWISKNFCSEGRFSIGSTGHKNMFISLGLNGSRLEAKGGIVGGSIDMGQINTYCHLKEDADVEPFHQMGVLLDVIEVRFDYMGTSVLMGRVSHFLIRAHDDWHVTDHVSDLPTMKPAQIFVKGDLSWDQLQLLFSKSTTADLIKIYNKLEEFFSQQFKSSKKLFSSLEPGSFAGFTKPQEANDEDESKLGNSNSSYCHYHHRHWQKALRKISGLKIYTLPLKLPDIGSVLGGVLELHGRHISLACFHGINFKSKSWALFSLKDPSISFVSDAQEIMEDVDGKSVKRTNIIQAFSLSLGESDQPTTKTQHAYMATVKKISRNVNYLPPIKALTDWFNYAFRSSELDQVSRFPSLSPSQEKERDTKSQQRTEEIFALPCLRMDLKTKHVQDDAKLFEDSKPVVDCTFVTDFDNHIFVTTDAEAFFFLHDLITSYVKEKDRVLSIQSHSITDKSSGESKGLSSVDPLQKDFRQFECKAWHLEPTVRLISWAGSQMEPYGVDYILQRLGFSHARTTIPKWLQRGCMDPLDKILSMVVLKTIQVVQEERNREESVTMNTGRISDKRKK